MQQLCKIFLLLTFNLKYLKSEYSENCKFLEGNQFQEYCRGVYPQEFAIKYHDGWVRIGEPYVIYRSLERPTEFVLTFKDSPLHACKTIEVFAADRFTCIFKTQQGKTQQQSLNLTLALDACFPLHLYITDDLVRICLHQNKRSDKLEDSTKSVFQYTLNELLLSSGTVGVAMNLNCMLSVYHISLKYLIAFAYKQIRSLI